MESCTSPSQLLAELRDLRAAPSRRPDLVIRIGLSLERAHKLETLNNRDGQSGLRARAEQRC